MTKIYEYLTHQSSTLIILLIHSVAICSTHYVFSVVFQFIADDSIKYFIFWVFSFIVETGLAIHALQAVFAKNKQSTPTYKRTFIAISLSVSPKTPLTQNKLTKNA